MVKLQYDQKFTKKRLDIYNMIKSEPTASYTKIADKLNAHSISVKKMRVYLRINRTPELYV